LRFLESGLGRLAELWKVYKNVNGLVVVVLSIAFAVRPEHLMELFGLVMATK
jgi:hypothetical protein